MPLWQHSRAPSADKAAGGDSNSCLHVARSDAATSASGSFQLSNVPLGEYGIVAQKAIQQSDGTSVLYRGNQPLDLQTENANVVIEVAGQICTVQFSSTMVPRLPA
jgi:hypothetical protein